MPSVRRYALFPQPRPTEARYLVDRPLHLAKDRQSKEKWLGTSSCSLQRSRIHLPACYTCCLACNPLCSRVSRPSSVKQCEIVFVCGFLTQNPNGCGCTLTLLTRIIIEVAIADQFRLAARVIAPVVIDACLGEVEAWEFIRESSATFCAT